MTLPLHKEEYDAGRQAFLEGKDYFDAPYMPARTSAERWQMYAWCEGFDEAERQQREAAESKEAA